MDIIVYTITDMESILDILNDCRGVKQDPRYHPEGDVYVHSIQAFYRACHETKDIDLVFAALLHDVGKTIDNHGHEQYAIEMLRENVSIKTLWLIEQHMRIWAYLKGEMKRLGKCLELISHPWFSELIQLARFDKMARNQSWHPQSDRERIVEKLNKVVNKRWIKKYESKQEDPDPIASL